MAAGWNSRKVVQRTEVPGRRSAFWCAAARSSAALLLSVLLLAANYAQSGPPSEYQVKAAFLFHFAQFVEWPAGAFHDPGVPLTYCILGEDPFQGAMESAFGGKSVGTHPLRTKHVKQVQEAIGCHVLFMAAGERKSVAEAVEGLRGSPVLTVGDSDHFAQEGGMIGFLLEDNKVRFEINLGAAERGNLKISAKLLALAKTVIVGPPKGS